MPDLTASPTGQRSSEIQLNEYDSREWLMGRYYGSSLRRKEKKKYSQPRSETVISDARSSEAKLASSLVFDPGFFL